MIKKLTYFCRWWKFHEAKNAAIHVRQHVPGATPQDWAMVRRWLQRQ